ncbi:DUF502 domain-containing protein [Solimonas fluminis]|uniref:DUF502 domain-containing protein n=1 Tax=Solimonas fluminis TaxID=2086571 RepID=UPI001FAF0E54|nr:DUF502 domain-containing protein [Solimonas fluminis]
MNEQQKQQLRKIAGTFFTGLLAVLPILVTVALVMWLIGAAEAVLGGLLGFLLPRGLYLPGMGLLVAIVLIYLVGLGMKGLFVQQAFGWLESALNRIPLVKTVYGAVRDLTGFMSNKRERKFGQVVMVQMPNLPIRLVGFVTVDDLVEAGIAGCDTGGCVAVYLPMSYQIGGYTVMLPRQYLTPLDMSFEEAMRFVITAGMSRPNEEPPRGTPPAA